MIRILSFIIGFIIIFKIVYDISSKIEPLHGGHKYYVNNILLHADSIEAITLGNSHSRSIDFNTLGKRGAYLNYDFMDCFELYQNIINLIPKLPNLKVVYIAASPYLTYIDNAKYDTYQNQLRQRHYHVLNGIFLIDNDYKNFCLSYLNVVVRPDGWSKIIKRILPSFITDKIIFRNTQPKKDIKLNKHAEHRVSLHKAQIDRVFEVRPSIQEDAKIELEKAIEFLLNRDIEVVFFTPPYSSFFQKLYEKEVGQIDNDIKYFESLKKYPNVRYYNFFGNPSFSNSDSLFYDSDHLNAKGRIVFSQKLMDTLALYIQ